MLYTKIASNNDVSKFKNQRCIIKMHGDFESKNIVLKEEDYLNYSKNYELIESIVKSIFLTNTIVFIGYGINDYNVKLILNWIKNFKLSKNKPIFINLDESFNKNEIHYHESRGLQIIEFNQLCSNKEKKNDYHEKYRFVLNYLLNNTDDSFSKDDNKNFEILYQKLSVYKNLNSIKPTMISDIVKDYFYLSNNSLNLIPNKYNVLTKFLSAYCGDISLGVDEQRKFEIIKETFRKSNIFSIICNKDICSLSDSLLNTYCEELISFDFSIMDVYKYDDTLASKYKKAFFLVKLFEFDKALELYSNIYHLALINKDYTFQYLSYLNIQYLKKYIDHSFFQNKYDKENSEDEFNNQTFELVGLRIELLPNYPMDLFKKFNNYFGFNAVYKDGHFIYQQSESLQNVYIKNTIELGITSIQKAKIALNEYISFFTGNMLLYDCFKEFKSPLKNLLVSKIKYYLYLSKKDVSGIFKLTDEMKQCYFTKLDFYCLVNCFEYKEIIQLFKNNKIKFSDEQEIKQNIKKTFQYIASNKLLYGTNISKVFYFRNIIKNIFAVYYCFDFTEVELFELVKYLFENCLKFIFINEICDFLSQHNTVIKQEKENNISNYILQKLNELIALETEKVLKNEEFSIRTTNSNFKYHELVFYINDFVFNKNIDNIVDNMVKSDVDYFLEPIIFYYYDKCSIELKNIINNYIHRKLNDSFDYDVYLYAVEKNMKFAFESIYIKQVEDYLDNKISMFKTILDINLENDIGPFREILFVNYVTAKYPFVNKYIHKISDEMDFLIEQENFDFDNFDLEWLLNYRTGTRLKLLASNQNVKYKIKDRIIHQLDKNEYKEDFEKFLLRVLTKYFN